MKRLLVAMIGLLSASLFATDGTWTKTEGNGDWSDRENWQGGQIADGEGAGAHLAYGTEIIRIPDSGVTVGHISTTGVRTGNPVLWGGPITLKGDAIGFVGADSGTSLRLACPVSWTGEAQFARMEVTGPMNSTGDTYVNDWCNINDYLLFGANEAGKVPYDFLPTGRMRFMGNTSLAIVPRAPSAATTATFAVTEGSEIAETAAIASELLPGCTLSGEGVAEGTFVKAAFPNGRFQLSAPATKTGSFSLDVSAMPGGGSQTFREIRSEGGLVTVGMQNRKNGSATSYPTVTVGEYTSTSAGSLKVSGWGGKFSLGIGDDCLGSLLIENNLPVEVTPLTATARLGKLSASGTAPGLTVKEGTLTVDRLDGSVALTKRGSGNLAIEIPYAGTASAIVADEGPLTVSSGGRAAAVTLPAGVAFHVDATKLASMEFVTENGTNFVNRWHDASGGTMQAYYKDYGQYNGLQKNRRPFLEEDAQAGLPVVNFGTVQSTITWSWRTGYGGTLDFSSVLSNVREVFVVMKDIPGVAGTGRMGCLTNPSGDSYYPFLRGSDGTICEQTNTAQMLKDVRGGLIELDGAEVASTTILPNGFHLLHFRTLAGVRADAFCSDRGYATGGLCLGEVIVYEKELTDDETSFIENYLQSKWFKKGEAPERTIASVTTSTEGAELVAEEGQTLVVAELTMNGPVVKKGAGKLRIGTLVNPNNYALTVEGGSVDVPDGETMTVRDLNASANGTIAKDGDGTLVATVLGGGLEAVDVRGGTLKLASGAKPTGMFFHVDASDEATYDTFESNDRTYVSTVRDASGGTVTASPKQSKKGTIANPSPYIDRSYLDGKPVFNFGSMFTADNLSGEGGNLCWSAKANDFRECFLVYADHPSCVESGVGQFILGGHSVGDDNIHPFWRDKLQLLYNGDAWGAMGCSVFYGLKQVDGIDRAYSYSLPSGFHILRFQTTRDASKSPEKGLADVMVNAFACEREYNMGGQMIAEALIFNGASLSDADAQAAYDYLYAKWFKAGSGTAYELDALSVAPGATFDLGSIEATTAALTGGGTVRTPQLSLAEGTVWNVKLAGEPLASSPTTVDGTLSLATAGQVVLSVDGDAERIPAGIYPIASATQFEGLGNLANWTVTAAGRLLKGRSATLVVKDGQLAVEVVQFGLTVILR